MTITFDRIAGHTVGLDLGQSQDFTAICVLERINAMQGETILSKRYAIRHLARIKLGTPYDEIVEIVCRLMKALPPVPGRYRPSLIVDGTGVGRPVVDLLKRAGLYPVSVTITGGAQEHDGGNFTFSIPKRNLVSALQIVFGSGRLKISRDLPHADDLVNELLNFRVTISSTGHDSYDAWRERIHDDLVLATSLSVWFNERYARPAQFTNAFQGLMQR